MASRESFLLRTDPEILAALRRWASDELRSANAQLDFVLRRALRDAGRLPSRHETTASDAATGEDAASGADAATDVDATARDREA